MVLRNGTIITPLKELHGMEILTAGDRITEVRTCGGIAADDERKTTADNKGRTAADNKGGKAREPECVCSAHDNRDVVIDACGGYILPGLVDIHTHGALGASFMDADMGGFERILRHQASQGVTSVLGATLTAPVSETLNCISAMRGYMKLPSNGSEGARLIGVYAEGPYFSVVRKGAQPGEYLLVPDKDDYSFLIDNADMIKIVSLSPELPGCVKMIRALTAAGIVVAGGHDDAVDYEVDAAIEAGMSHATHIYCSMSSLTKRNGRRHTGLSEASLTEDSLSAEIIADNQHLPPRMIKLIYKCKGADKLCIISDCLMVAGLPKGQVYDLSSTNGESRQRIFLDEHVAVLEDRSFFAGSIQFLGEMVRNVAFDAGVPLMDAVRMASLSPAKVVKMDDSIGSIEPGKRADFCIIDKDLQVVKTVIGGRLIYSRDQNPQTHGKN